MKTIFKVLPLCVCLIIFSCGDEGLKKVEQLTEFRVLGIVASAPEVAPGGVSNLTLIVSDPNGGGRTLVGDVELCTDPGIALGASVSCAHDSAKVSTTYSINTITDTDLGAANLYTGLATSSLAVTVPATILTGRTAREQFNGVAYLAIFTFNDNGRQVRAFKRIIATNRASLNTNPTASAINLNGSAITTRPGVGDALSVTTSGAETYDIQNVDGTVESRSESFEAAWFVTAGEINAPQSLASSAVRYKSIQAGVAMVVIVVVRDERGGLAFRRASL
jgi:hypothetical protein